MVFSIKNIRTKGVSPLAKSIAVILSALLCFHGVMAVWNQHFVMVLNRYHSHVVEAFGVKAQIMGFGNIALGLMPLGLIMPTKATSVAWCLLCFGAGFCLLFFNR